MARHRVPVPIVDALARRTDEHQRRLLIDSYRDLATESAALLPQSVDPDQPWPRQSRHLAALDECLSLPATVRRELSGWDVLTIARRRSLL